MGDLECWSANNANGLCDWLEADGDGWLKTAKASNDGPAAVEGEGVGEGDAKSSKENTSDEVGEEAGTERYEGGTA